ncbi:MAG: prepilin-type N-terminal cleavage/methylation domain-containing protein [Nitrospiria bacterium]
MQTLKVGTCKESRRTAVSTLDHNGGFTLLELILVILILGFTALLVAPKLSSFGAGNMKRTIRHLSGLIQHLAQESAATKRAYRLHFDLEEGAYWVSARQGDNTFATASDPLLAGRRLPRGISFEDVITSRQGKVNEGEAYTEIFWMGLEKSVIHIKEEARVWSLIVNPLTGHVKVDDRYVE